ncbi:LysM peptidoglycan-binding domain-containing protein [Priestia sp. SIMBA_032]
MVVKGELLRKISKKYRTTVAKLKSANNLKSDLIRISQKLPLKTCLLVLTGEL